jgi:hypothetical protein
MRITNISFFLDYQIIVTIIMVVVSWKYGDWRNWKLYHPTILYYVSFAFLYSLLTYNYPLWEFESPLLKTTLSDVLISCIFVPATILIYIYHFPIGWVKQTAYVILWVIIYTLTEIISYSLGYFSYYHGWNIWWSTLFNCAMFPLLYLHFKKPLLAIAIAVICTIFGMIYWNVPINSMK